jgi:hypothetical protein
MPPLAHALSPQRIWTQCLTHKPEPIEYFPGWPCMSLHRVESCYKTVLATDRSVGSTVCPPMRDVLGLVCTSGRRYGCKVVASLINQRNETAQRERAIPVATESAPPSAARHGTRWTTRKCDIISTQVRYELRVLPELRRAVSSATNKRRARLAE